ncbi:hypothetical protein [Duganella vulcania]|uniref:hypothetical protein n=1 Tax=Duganella vulcania TaxID=2692166 RepID=UPI0035305A0E
MTIPISILDALDRADASWRPLLVQGLEAMMAATPDYLPQLARDQYLPTEQRLFAAFSLPLQYVLSFGIYKDFEVECRPIRHCIAVGDLSIFPGCEAY